MAKRVAVLVSGRGSNLQALIDGCARPGSPAAIALVLSDQPDALALERARSAGIATALVQRRDYGDKAGFEDALHNALIAHDIELVCLAGFMRILGAALVERWWNRMLNIHPSLLPAFPGLDTHARALEAGVKLHGCTVHVVRAEVDAGPIVIQAAVPVFDDDTPDRLAGRVLAQEHRIYPQALAWLAENRLTVDGGRVVGPGPGATTAAAAAVLVQPTILAGC